MLLGSISRNGRYYFTGRARMIDIPCGIFVKRYVDKVLDVHRQKRTRLVSRLDRSEKSTRWTGLSIEDWKLQKQLRNGIFMISRWRSVDTLRRSWLEFLNFYRRSVAHDIALKKKLEGKINLRKDKRNKWGDGVYRGWLCGTAFNRNVYFYLWNRNNRRTNVISQL